MNSSLLPFQKYFVENHALHRCPSYSARTIEITLQYIEAVMLINITLLMAISIKAKAKANCLQEHDKPPQCNIAF